ncbi:MAG: hypothetical protein ACM3Y9_07540, partial [Ignavibacteria bacterium]
MPPGSLKLRWLFVAAMLPGLVALVVSLGRSYQRERDYLDSRAMQAARSLSQAVDKEIFSAQKAMQGLAIATVTDVSRRDFGSFYRTASEVIRRTGVADAIVLTEGSGQQVVNTLVPFGASLPRTQNIDRVREVFATGEPYVSDLLHGTVSKRMLITIDVPVMREGRVIYDLNAVLMAERLNHVLQAQGIADAWVGVVYDRNATIAARTRDPER